MNKKTKDFSELLALEKTGKYQEALECIQVMARTAQGESPVRSLNLKLLEQRLLARLKLPQQPQESKQSISLELPNTAAEDQRKPTWSAIITMWKRQDYLAEQLAAIRAQSIPPEEIIIILNEGHIPESKIRDIGVGGVDIKIIRSDINSLYTRWAVAYIAKGEYVSIFDDDVIPGRYWIANAIRACSSYNALVGPAGRIYNKNGIHGYYKLVIPNAENQNTIGCGETDVYCDWVCNSYLFKRKWVGYALSYMRYKDVLKTFDDIQLATTLYFSGKIRCVIPMQPSFDNDLHGSLQKHYGNDSHAIWKTNSDQHFAGRKLYIEELIQEGYLPVQERDNLFRFHIIVPFGERSTLERCLLSVKGQDYKNFTCTLVDDCCDGKDALDLLKRLELDKENFRYIKTTKKVYPLRAREMATDTLCANPAEVIVHLDGDDWLPYPDVLSRLNRIYRKGGVLASYGNAVSVRSRDRSDFHEYEPYEMSCRWNISQNNANAEVILFRQVKETEIKNGWKDAPWCGMHLRTFQFSKWIGLNRKTFRNNKGEYHKVGTDAAIFIPVLDSCRYDSIVFVTDLAYVYQNSGNTIHAKNEISLQEKAETLTSIADAEHSINNQRIKQFLINKVASMPNDNAHIVYNFQKTNRNMLSQHNGVMGRAQRINTCAFTIVTPHYLADAILCLISYQRNLREDCQLFVFIATDKDRVVANCEKLLADSGIVAIFPNTLRYTQTQSQSLLEKYSIDTDEYRWSMKAVVLLELLNGGYSLALFLDPDTYTVSDITNIHQRLAYHPISVFPHFRDPDHNYLRGVLYKDGFFNGGMLAATPNGIKHLTRLYERCLNELKKEPARHLWDDQKYFDLFALEVENLHVNHDRGIDYNPWNYEPVEGVIAPSQRSVLLKSGYFVRHWHVSTMLIKNSIDLKEKKFSVYRPLVSIYLLSICYIIIIILYSARIKGASYLEDFLGLKGRFNNIIEIIKKISEAIPTSDAVRLLKHLEKADELDHKIFLNDFTNSLLNSICFDNYELFARAISIFAPEIPVANKLVNYIRCHDVRHISDKHETSMVAAIEDIDMDLCIDKNDNLLNKQLQNLKFCRISY